MKDNRGVTDKLCDLEVSGSGHRKLRKEQRLWKYREQYVDLRK